MKEKWKLCVRGMQKFGILNFTFIILFEYLFDWYYAIDTRTVSPQLEEDVLDKRSFSDACPSQPSNLLYLRIILNHLPICKAQTILLDYGSGKGRIMCYLLKQGVKHVTGVEFNQKEISICRDNLNKLKLSEDNYCLALSDASTYNIPSDVNTIVLFNPFTGKVLESVFLKIVEHAKRHSVYVFFINQVATVPSEFLLMKKFKYNCYLYYVK